MTGVLPAGSWADPAHLATRRLPMHVPFTASATAAGARTGAPDDSPWVRRLDGEWAFSLVDHPDQVSAELVGGPRDGWAAIEVPGSWTMQGFDQPQYTNVQMPWPYVPPALPHHLPTGVYRRTIDVPAEWSDRRVVLHVGGAESILYAFVDGVLAGSATDSRLPSELDLTPFVTAGRPAELALVVVRWGVTSYLEDQDQWWMAGLHREVLLRADAQVRIADVVVQAGVVLDELAGPLTAQTPVTGRLAVRVPVAFPALDLPGRGWAVEVRLEALDGAAVAGPWRSWVAVDRSPYVFHGFVAEVEAEVPGVLAWSAESPERYRVLVQLLDPDGESVEWAAQVVGFRNVEVSGGLLKVNGAPIRIRGVNRHDHHPERGKAVTAADIRADLLTMKRHGVNAVRTSHYPNDPSLYDQCDELGLYVFDEANLETHAFNELLCHDPAFLPAWVARVSRMVLRDRNHPCVIAWSLGNESGYGPNHDAAAGWVRRVDPSRPLHYEGAIFLDWEGGRAATDLVCPMYAPLEAAVAWAERGPHDRPFVYCEYSHAMGNSNGMLADHEDAFESYEQLQGGFVWEWKDHGLRQALPDGRVRLAYGGQFGDEPNDGTFVADGLVSPYGEPHPAMRELAWCNRPVAVDGYDAASGTLRVRSRRSFATLDDLAGTWRLLSAGEEVAAGELDVGALQPGATAELRLALPAVPGGSELLLSVEWHQRARTEWAPAGAVVAWDQVVVRQPAGFPVIPGWLAASTGAPDLREAAGGVSLRWGEAEALVDAASGHLISLRAAGRELLAGPLRLTLWRAPFDNDGLKTGPIRGVGGKAKERWAEQGLRDPQRVLVALEVDGDSLVARHELRHRGGTVVHEQRLTPLAGGLVVDDVVEVPAELDDPARIGHSALLAPDLDRLAWYGRGPGENLTDRKRGSLLGTYRGDPDDLPYLVPQSYGQRCDVRWFAVRDARGTGLAVVAEDPVGLVVAAVAHADEALDDAFDHLDLVRAPGLVLHVDVAQRGTGTASCGPDTAARYRVTAGRWEWRWRLAALRGASRPA